MLTANDCAAGAAPAPGDDAAVDADWAAAPVLQAAASSTNATPSNATSMWRSIRDQFTGSNMIVSFV
jgi:hypothetical protein